MANRPPALSHYVDRIEQITSSEDPAALLSHAYVRYLGDLSGGQVIRGKIAKAYNLEDGAGVSFYDFKTLGGTGAATIGDMKKIKEWYRDNMNTVVGDNQELKGDFASCSLLIPPLSLNPQRILLRRRSLHSS